MQTITGMLIGRVALVTGGVRRCSVAGTVEETVVAVHRDEADSHQCGAGRNRTSPGTVGRGRGARCGSIKATHLVELRAQIQKRRH